MCDNYGCNVKPIVLLSHNVVQNDMHSFFYDNTKPIVRICDRDFQLFKKQRTLLSFELQ